MSATSIHDVMRANLEAQMNAMTTAMTTIVRENTKIFTEYQAQFKKVIEANAEMVQKAYGSDDIVATLKAEAAAMIAQLKQEVKNAGGQ